jgi:hypothetical protein
MAQITEAIPHPGYAPAGTYLCRAWCSSHDDGTCGGILPLVTPSPADQVCYHDVPAPGGPIHLTHALDDGPHINLYGDRELSLAEAQQLAYAILATVAMAEATP